MTHKLQENHISKNLDGGKGDKFFVLDDSKSASSYNEDPDV